MQYKNLISDKDRYDALVFASNAHSGQVRKYSGDPYISHPIAVALIVSMVPGATTKMVQAALLHDVVEDCGVLVPDLADKFGIDVASMVSDLSIQKDPSLLRADKKMAYNLKLAGSSDMVQTIKLADSLHNAPSIIACDPKFAKQWVGEVAVMLDSLRCGDSFLHKKLSGIVRDFNAVNCIA